MQPSRTIFSKLFSLVAHVKRNNACNKFEKNSCTQAAAPACESFISDSSDAERTQRMRFFGKRSHGRRSRAILEGLSAIARACGGAYPVSCWGVVQSVGHLTVNEDGGGSNPPAPANSMQTRFAVV